MSVGIAYRYPIIGFGLVDRAVRIECDISLCDISLCCVVSFEGDCVEVSVGMGAAIYGIVRLLDLLVDLILDRFDHAGVCAVGFEPLQELRSLLRMFRDVLHGVFDRTQLLQTLL